MALLLRSSSSFAKHSTPLLLPLLTPLNKRAASGHRMTLSPSTLSLSAKMSFSSQFDDDEHMTMIISKECSRDVSWGRKLALKHTKQPSRDFCSFIRSTPKEEVVAFFRQIAKELECNRQIHDFHMKVLDENGDFRVEIYYGVEKSGPEVVPLSNCISCHPNAPLYPGLEPCTEARECVLTEFTDQPYAVCRLDAKARCGFIITPTRHVDRMSELDDDELHGLWSLAVRTLRHAGLPFTSMVLNHGTYRNVEHLHLKVWVDKDLYAQYQACWSKERLDLWKRLQDLALRRPKKRVLLKRI